MRNFANVLGIYVGSDGDATKALYADLEQLGPAGVVAINLFRACKASERAKVYRSGARGRGSYRAMAYDKKQWSMEQLCRALAAWTKNPVLWGWGIDRRLKGRGAPHYHVLYVDLPTGQVSFHTADRCSGPDYAGEWDGTVKQSPARICRWIDHLFNPGSPASSDVIPPRSESVDAPSDQSDATWRRVVADLFEDGS